MGKTIDSVTRFFAFGQPGRLIDLDLRLVAASTPPGSWAASHQLGLSWTDLGDGIGYELRVGHGSRSGNGLDVKLGTFSESQAVVNLPGDGEWFIRVRPMSGGDGGQSTTFGPFRVDSTAPPSPGLEPILPPPGYTFSLSWSPVGDTSGIVGYDVERKVGGTGFRKVIRTTTLTHLEDQLGNGDYTYRIRAVNGAGTWSLPSNEQKVLVKAPMSNPGEGSFLYGVHANYTSFMKIWDISDPGKYATIDEVPAGIRNQYLGGGYGFEVGNGTLAAKAREIVGAQERNTLVIAEKLFVWLFDHADYDSGKLTASQKGDGGGLQSAGETYDRKLGICGDLSTLYITMLRIAGVPARPVHGYLDNPGAGVGDFHVWAEVWVGASLRSGDPTDTRDDWMTVDVSGVSDPFDVDALMVYFGIFNPEYLALGLNADYNDSSWNAWAQFGWSVNPGMGNPQFAASGRPVELDFEAKDLYFSPTTKKRVLVEPDSDPPQGFTMFFPDVKAVSKKRIDYGVNVNGAEPVNATIRIRHPDADAFAAVLPWQSVIYTIYTHSPTVEKEPGKQYTRLDPLGYVVWEDRFS